MKTVYKKVITLKTTAATAKNYCDRNGFKITDVFETPDGCVTVAEKILKPGRAWVVGVGTAL